MFDLFRSREKTVRYLLGAVLVLVALSMVITLIPGFGGGFGDQTDQRVVATIGGEPLTEIEVRQAIQRQMRERSMPPQMAEFYVPVFVNQMVQERALEFKARQLGFQVSEEELANALRSLLPMLYQDGKFAGRDAYASVLSQQGMTIPEFEANVKKQLIANRLEALALEGVVVTPTEVEQEFRRKNEKLKIGYFPVTMDLFRKKVTASQDEMQDYFNKNRPAYQIPEQKSFTIFVVDEAKVGATVTAPEADLRRAYDLRREQFRLPERVRVRHILLKTTDKTPEEVAKIEKRMQDLLKQAKGGANFAELATKNSEDPASAVKGGDLDFVTRGQMVPEFEKAMFELKPGEISGLVKTIYGFHILKGEAREDGRIKSFEEVKPELAKDLNQQVIAAKVQSLADGVRAALIKSVADAEQYAQANGISVVRAAKVADGGPVPEVGASPDFKEGVARVAKGGVTNVIRVEGDKLVVARVDDVLPPRQAELPEVQERVRAAVVNAKAEKLLADTIEGLKTKVKQPGADLAKLAKEIGAEYKTPAEFAYDGAVEGMGPATALEAVFRMNPGDTFGPITISGGQNFFGKVVEKTPADLTKLAAERAAVVQAIKTKRARERRDLFADGILKQLIADKKVKVNNDVVQRLAVSYREG